MKSPRKNKVQKGKKRLEKTSEPFAELQQEVAEAIRDAVRATQDVVLPLDTIVFEIPPHSDFGDLAIPCFALSRVLKKNPAQIATQLEAAISHSLIEKTQAAGPYLNIHFKPTEIAIRVLEEIFASKNFGLSRRTGETVVIEYISPNTNKPIHLGHARNGFLGDSIARLLKTTGKKVIKTCLINDRGIHICKSMVAYQEAQGSNRQTREKTPQNSGVKGDHFVGDYYVRFEQLLKQDASYKDKAAACLLLWESGDVSTRALWKKMNSWVLAGFKETFAALGLTFDKVYYESGIYKKGREVIKKAVKSGHFKDDSSGAVIARLENYGLPDKVLLRSDGTSLYITQDIYLAEKRLKDFKANATLYVVGSEQDMYFKQLFKVIELIQPKYARGLAHISYGIVNLPEGRMKSREGTVVDIDDLLTELTNMAGKEFDERNIALSKKERIRRAQIIALGALKFFILEVTPRSDMIFNPKESLSFHGRTGPYIQYTYARLKSILKKSKISQTAIKKKPLSSRYDWKAEKSIILSLAKYPATIQEAAHTYDPSRLARYLYELAKTSNEYYHLHPILTAEEPARRARLHLIIATSSVLRDGLALLGIETLEEM